MSVFSGLSRFPLLKKHLKPHPVVAVVRLCGIIGSLGGMRRGLSLAAMSDTLTRAFALKGTEAVALVVNSPGGSPVQSALIHKRIRALAAEHEKPVLTFCEDVAASGGYILALAGDEIFADEASLLGSIGVISSGFGFPALLRRFGIERRLYTAGAHKGMLDPFQPENPADVERLKAIQAEVHEGFKSLVRERRAGKLTGEESELFSGAFWAGIKAQELGLIDRIGDLHSVLRDRYGEKVKLKLVAPGRRFPWVGLATGAEGECRASTPFQARLQAGGGALSLDGTDLGQGLLAAAEERLLWQRFGL